MIRKVLLGLIRLYQRTISPVLPQSCIYVPSCSEYMYQSLEKYGVFKGVYLGVRRILRCHPWGRGGYDPVK